MSSRKLRTIVVVLFLAAAVAGLPTAAHARPLGIANGGTPQVAHGEGLFSMVWRFLTHLWSKEGGSLDPDGSHHQSAAPTGNGQSISPTAPGVIVSDEGGSLDPHG
ncbi:MAG TPA: hypothetical protein VOA87_12755 [Thermoanaerobaculia bacterium]|nr:hypothetical protein [Thermoanaerobaculia bacterium]